jgi:hypothetical protein
MPASTLPPHSPSIPPRPWPGTGGPPRPVIGESPVATPLVVDSAPARVGLRAQIARLERRLAALAADLGAPGRSLPLPGAGDPAADRGDGPRLTRPRASRGPRLLDLGELERARDELVRRVRGAEALLGDRAEREGAAARRLAAMLAAPERHRFERVLRADLGLPGCGAYEVRPRLGLVGMLAGWWEVKLSSGCPLPRSAPAPRRFGSAPRRFGPAPRRSAGQGAGAAGRSAGRSFCEAWAMGGVRPLAILPALLAVLLTGGCGGGGKSKTQATTATGVPVAQSGADGRAAARVAEAYIRADGSGKGARTCKLVAASVRARFAHQRGGCAKALGHPPVDVASQRAATIQLSGSTAVVGVIVPGGPTRQITLQKEGGAWRVSNGGT